MDNISLEERVVRRLVKEGYTISTVESLTGGMLSSAIVSVAGASEVFMQGLVTYSNEAKHRLAGVPWETINTYGAVSRFTAMAMAEGGAKGSQTDICISTTGIAGPTGGTAEKPVGLVYVGCYIREKLFYKECRFSGDRLQIREASVKEAFEFLLRCMDKVQEECCQK